MLQKLRTIIYHSSDLQAAKAWYTRITGIEPYFDEPFYVGFDINGFELGIDPDTSNAGEGNHTVAYWSVEGITDGVDKMIAAGASLVQAVTNVGGPIHVAIVEDPFGNHVGLIEGA